MSDPSESPEPVKICPVCGKENPDSFAVCWSCQADLSHATAIPTKVTQPAPTTGAVAAETTSLPRTALRVELLVVLGLTWVPVVAAGIQRALAPPGSLRGLSPATTLLSLGFVGLLVYLIWRDRGSLASLGVTQVVWWREIAFAVVLVVAAPLLFVLANVLARWIDLPSWSRDSTTSALVHRGPFTAVALLIGVSAEELQRAYVIIRLGDLGARPAVGVFTSALIFTIAHVYSPAGSLPVFFFGLLFGSAFSATRRLPRLLLAHWVTDLIVLGWFQ